MDFKRIQAFPTPCKSKLNVKSMELNPRKSKRPIPASYFKKNPRRAWSSSDLWKFFHWFPIVDKNGHGLQFSMQLSVTYVLLSTFQLFTLPFLLTACSSTNTGCRKCNDLSSASDPFTCTQCNSGYGLLGGRCQSRLDTFCFF